MGSVPAARRAVCCVLVAAALSLGIPSGSQAGHCNDLVMFAHVVHDQPFAINGSGMGCAIGSGHTADLYAFPPGTVELTVRYTNPDQVAGDRESLPGHIVGLGVNSDQLVLRRFEEAEGQVVFDSPPIRIDGSARGSITATVQAPLGPQAVTYRTTPSS